MSDLILYQSKYHYWRLIKSSYSNLYYLDHKHKLDDSYHRQFKHPMTVKKAMAAIKAHDNYVATHPRKLS